MKMNGMCNRTKIALIAFLLVISVKSVFSQPDYTFNSYSLISGTNLQVGSKYRFTSVKPGLDAIVTITAFTGGITINNLDGGSGYVEALQPVIDIPANSNGYAEFQIDFVAAGTLIPVIQTEVATTFLDIDAGLINGNYVYEYDEVKKTNGYIDYSMIGTDISVTTSNPWVTGKNVAGIDYTGIDTGKKQVMFSVVNANVSTVTVRMGAQNNSNSSTQRLTSLYFKKFTYPNSFLAIPYLNFNGRRQDKEVILQWQLTSTKNISAIVIERGTQPGKFTAIAEVWPYSEEFSSGSFSYPDKISTNSNLYYRLKIKSVSGQISYSNVLVLREVNDKEHAFKMYPTILHDFANVSITSSATQNASLQLLDYSGRTVYRLMLSVSAGVNNFTVSGFEHLPAGNYVAVVTLNNESLTQKAVKQ